MSFHRPYFINPLLGGADPCICRGNDGKFYFVVILEDGLGMYCSESLADPGKLIKVLELPKDADGNLLIQDIWAPEIHEIRGEYYVYFAASVGPSVFENWPNRRMYAAHCKTPDGTYDSLTKLELGEYMAIDGTVLQMPNGDLYMIYMRCESPCETSPEDPSINHNKLFIVKMSDPLTIEGEPVELTRPEYPWETTITEGAFPLIHDDKIYLTYSGNYAHVPGYCIGLLTCVDPEHPLDKKSWVKSPEPIFKSFGNVYGTGHASIVKSADGTEEWLIYHSKYDEADTLPEGWNRIVNAKKISWNEDGTPNFGTPPQYGEKVPLPSGESDVWEEGGNWTGSLQELADMLQPYSYWAELVSTPQENCICCHIYNSARYATKALFRKYEWVDAQITATVSADTAERETGLIARASYAYAGNNRFDGYMALIKGDHIAIYRVDGEERTELAAGVCQKEEGTFEMSFCAKEDRLTVLVNGKEVISACDNNYPHGRMGFYCEADTTIYSAEIKLC